jgi:hypothetical protein
VNRIHGGARRLPGEEADQGVELRGRKRRRHGEESGAILAKRATLRQKVAQFQ